MSTLPSRTRSLRKPADSGSGSRYDRLSVAENNEGNASFPSEEPKPPVRSSQSPSRLPVKPSTRSTTTARPPSSAGSVISNASIRPPPSRANIGKPTTTSGGLQRSTSSSRRTNPTTSAEPVKQDRSRPPLTQSRHLRDASASSLSTSTRSTGHTRTKSSSTALSASTALRPPTRNSSEEPPRPPTAGESQLRRPAFSTLQQHFSPAKSLALKPHPAAFLAPPSPSKLPSNIAISAETAKLQNELLQLHLLHKDISRVEKEWRSSAKKKLASKFESVVSRNESLVHLEVKETGKINAAALKKWEDMGTPGWGLEEKIQVLDEVVTGLWNLGDSGGKYAKVVRKFERWLGRYQDILDAREHNDSLEDEAMVFLEELDVGWKDDCLVLGRKLQSWKDAMRDLGSPDSGSSLAAVVDGCQSLVRGMLTELNVMAQIERDAMRVELDWIKSMNDDVSEDDEGRPTAGAAWRLQ